ncbi:MAG: MerR family transcriptional regulator [Ktedonobacteraceae bacterium]|nr:MerR family transcriptional regulator [Ktedonobacteraceae bacterium]
MQKSEQHFTIEELAELVDLPVRTIRYYISEDLLPGPEGRGKAAIYGEEHLLRLRLIRLLSRQRVPVVEMRNVLARLSLDEVRALLAEEQQRAAQLEQAASEPPPEEYVATLLRNARAARQTYPAAPVVPEQERSGRVREVPAPAPSAPGQVPFPAVPLPGVPARDLWRRWELAPGIELHVRADAEQRHRGLLERLLRAAGKVYHRLNENM